MVFTLVGGGAYFKAPYACGRLAKPDTGGTVLLDLHDGPQPWSSTCVTLPRCSGRSDTLVPKGTARAIQVVSISLKGELRIFKRTALYAITPIHTSHVWLIAIQPNFTTSCASSDGEKSCPLGSGKQTSREVTSTSSAGSRHALRTTVVNTTPGSIDPDRETTPNNTDPFHPEAIERTEFEMETPTRRPARRFRSRSSGSINLAESSPLRPSSASEIDAATNQAETRMFRPNLHPYHTSPEMHEETERRSQRQDVPERMPSEPVTPGKLSGFQLDDDIAKLIKDGPARDRDKAKENGCIYFLKVRLRNSDVRLLKIGRTQKHPNERRSQINRLCRELEIEEHGRAVARDIPFHGFAESLIHKELSSYKYPFACSCGKKHREYFDVDESIAVEVFERWRDFCEKRPWDRSGNILPGWAQRLEDRARFAGAEQDFDHRNFARRWESFINPSIFEWLTSILIRVWRIWFPRRWLIVALTELLTIIFISTYSFWTTTWTVIIVSMMLLDQVVTEDMHTTARIYQLMGHGLQSLVPWQMPHGR